jgi:hypothetical protein
MMRRKEQAMIGHVISERDFSTEDHQQVAALPAPKFQARMSLVEARATLLAALRSLTAGGYTRRVGIIAREVCGARFGKYQPPEIVNWLRSDDFQEKFEEELEKWKRSWNPSSPAKAVGKRQIQYRACMRSITEKWWEKIADAIESMIASHAPQVVVQDSAGNKRVQSLMDVLDLMFFIPMTPARSAKLRVLGMQND